MEDLVPRTDAAEALLRIPSAERVPLLKNSSTPGLDTSDLSDEVKASIRAIGHDKGE
jgi:hypothetical protein